MNRNSCHRSRQRFQIETRRCGRLTGFAFKELIFCTLFWDTTCKRSSSRCLLFPGLPHAEASLRHGAMEECLFVHAVIAALGNLDEAIHPNSSNVIQIGLPVRVHIHGAGHEGGNAFLYIGLQGGLYF